ncbi:MAG: capsular biosynthesis protein [Sulfurovum sp.]|nr:capsular biosynthesis protein [Sulfurovum sp.]
MNKIGEIKDKNILFIQGPIGFFFKGLDLHFRKKGAKTFKITLNAADWLFSNRDNTYPFKGKINEWNQFIETIIKEKKIDKIFLFGDCRFYQSRAIAISVKLDIDIFVFEEGYVRPDFVTMERHGVNNFSKISRDPQFYNDLDDTYLREVTTLPAHPRYSRMAFAAIFYYIVSHLFSFRYPHYIHHREINAVKEFFCSCRNLFRKIKYQITEYGLLSKLTEVNAKKYYFVILQTYNDFQLIEHSRFDSIEQYITEVVESFAKHAPKDTLLVIKHHPVDRGRKNYKGLISKISKQLGVGERVITIYDLHLPTCLKNAIGTVTINSTVGLSSLFHKTPTITLGRAIYDMKGLTSYGITLDDFWDNYTIPNDKLFHTFRNYLIQSTQLNGSFYGRFPVELQKDEMYAS